MALNGSWAIPVAYKLAQEQAGSFMNDPVAGTVKLILLTTIPDATSPLIEFVDDVSGNQVTPGTGYPAGGPAVSNYAINDNGDGTINTTMDDLVIPQDSGGGFTNATAGALYIDTGTPSESRILYILDAGGTFGNTAGTATIDVAAAGIADR